ncbi:ileal sodium/bile acid cotransporter-like [Paramacrobiotus metropolitanus]|uniref:ileal sodium/bile acid cotransporter-like n=1 Tax=Paramacrobiotus metropolitanus TaxID=2943436 RepID=UPI002445E0A9|nr:ileal sodium/bile acid cotransporter-like [Paramacrobiotus metropolitanus]XP_055343854.1 ileal sodium/bile acid cotransporter-like [Paramacrobiotus metropolitanus]XP_055343855.1 ileal sodium/bile acid cotransporter-like [Paramacrobiotus metropolitanus]XP_055343856.1 ileal sodium/bile acid cotransporter-like [Paramacrobiotus metropolitanus]XP_055343857.1 ileal sodium/bile acid cotransporter-like [Paramacrobiotus metropolitanus]
MHLICVIGTLLLMLIPYAISQALNGIRSSSVGHRRLNCTFNPSIEYGLEKVHEETTANVTVECVCSAEAVTAGKVILLQIRPARSDIIELEGEGEEQLHCREDFSRTIWVRGKFLGRDNLLITATTQDEKDAGKETELVDVFPVSIIRAPSKLDTAFVAIIAILVGINTINMGCHLDLEVVKENLKKPCAIGIGFTSQYMFMPLIAYGVAMALFQEPNLQLGLFTMGCSPGGGASNFWTLLLEGDTNLSITMTFLSTALALGMMPFWLFTLGRSLFGNLQIRIPFSNILTSLIALTGPLAIGVLIRRYRPQWANQAVKCIRPFTILMMLFIFTFGVYANLYMFYVMNWRTMLAGLIVPWCGYVFGATLAVISKRSKEQVIAISVETGVQNTGIAIVLLRYSLPQPDADLGSVLPVCGSIMLFIPLFLWFLGLTAYNRCCKSRVMEVRTEEGSLEEMENGVGPVTEEKEEKKQAKIFTGFFKKNRTNSLPLPPSQQELLKPIEA